MKGIENMTLEKLLSMLMCRIDVIEYYDKTFDLLYRFTIDEIPTNCKDKILKFDIYHGTKENILWVIEK